MRRLTRDGTAEPVSRDQILRHARGEGNIHFPCSADHEQDWQPYPVDPYSAMCDHTYIHTTTVNVRFRSLEVRCIYFLPNGNDIDYGIVVITYIEVTADWVSTVNGLMPILCIIYYSQY